MDNPVIWSLPLSTWLILAWFLLACASTHSKRIWQAEREGLLPEGDESPPGCLTFLMVPQYGVLVYLALISWQQALSVFVITFLIATFLSVVMELIGGLVLVPFRVAQIATRGRRSHDLPREENDASPRYTYEERLEATNLMIDVMSEGELDLDRLAERLTSSYPQFDDYAVYNSIRAASNALSGYGIPDQLLEPEAEEVIAGAQSRDAQFRESSIALLRAKGKLEKAKADADLFILDMYRERLKAGSLYDPAESRISALQAAAVIYRFGGSLQESASECAPFLRQSLLHDSPRDIFDAFKVLYIMRWESPEERERLNNGYIHLTYFTADEIIDRVVQVGDRLQSPDYNQLIQDLPERMQDLMAEWRAFTDDIDSRMAEIARSAQDSE
ncbi:MAG: hypothetical protein WD716_06340 [Fimbriimonadaceae bacterium]